MVFVELGEYSEVLSVLIEGELIAEVSIKGTVVDKVAPVFSGIKDIVATEGIEYDARAGVSVSDNYDKTVDFGVNGLTFDLGEHIITYRAVDSSGNTTEVTAKLTVQQAEVVTEPVVVEPVAPPSNSGGGDSGGSSSNGGSSKPSVAPTPPPVAVAPVSPPVVVEPVAPPVVVPVPTPIDYSIMDAGGKLYGVPLGSYSSQEVAWYNYAFSASRAYGASLYQSEVWAMSYVAVCSSVGESNVVVGDPVGVGFGVWWYNPIGNTWKTG